jgi:RTX calcium-binding nonapeptide repeat (4 copies)
MPQMGRRNGTDAMHFFGHGRRAAAVAVTIAAALALAPAVAQASPSLIVSTTLAPSATVGETLPASLSLTNASTADDPSLTLCKVGDSGSCANSDGIVLIPSCGQDSGTACVAADPGVLSIDPTATGAGTCAGVTFLATRLEGAFGKVRLAATGAQDIRLSRGETCRVDFKFTVVRLPAVDARPQPGLQTVAIVAANATSYYSRLTTGGASSVVTINPGVPPAPSVTDTDPDAPANDNTPEVKGTAAAGSTVSVYTNSSCTGAPAARGTAEAFAFPGLTALVGDNTTTAFYVTATDPATGLSSPCSTSPRTYVEDSAAPETTIDSGPSGATDDTTPVFTFSANEPGARFACRFDSAAFALCASPFQAPPLSGGAHAFDVRAFDAVGNADPTPARRSFSVGTTFQASQLSACTLQGNHITGTTDNDDLRGTARTDIISGLSSSDVLRGLGGRDCLFGGGGTDRLFGGTGADLLFGGPDNDTLNGDAGSDRLSGDAGIDRLDGGAGNDALGGGAGPDRLTDRRGTDRFSGGAGNDRIDARDASAIGRHGRDRISCGPGLDSVLADRRDIVARDCERVVKR